MSFGFYVRQCLRPHGPRRIFRWIMTDPGNLKAYEAADLKENRTTHHVRDLATMMRGLGGGDQLPA
ncbi:hypothetical protein BIV25_21480 [Streptomyces sp. MUSC 14]|nr:hypothetical protein BIV25_21480 [Streptomyces sp. MUSC 14]